MGEDMVVLLEPQRESGGLSNKIPLDLPKTKIESSRNHWMADTHLKTRWENCGKKAGGSQVHYEWPNQ